jgi:hypothetical protein
MSAIGVLLGGVGICGVRNAPQLTFPINFFDQVVDGISQCQKLSCAGAKSLESDFI